MANAHLFFRTVSTPKSNALYDTSAKMLARANSDTHTDLVYTLQVNKQVLAFDISDYILESIGESYSNNIIDLPKLEARLLLAKALNKDLKRPNFPFESNSSFKSLASISSSKSHSVSAEQSPV